MNRVYKFTLILFFDAVFCNAYSKCNYDSKQIKTLYEKNAKLDTKKVISIKNAYKEHKGLSKALLLYSTPFGNIDEGYNDNEIIEIIDLLYKDMIDFIKKYNIISNENCFFDGFYQAWRKLYIYVAINQNKLPKSKKKLEKIYPTLLNDWNLGKIRCCDKDGLNYSEAHLEFIKFNLDNHIIPNGILIIKWCKRNNSIKPYNPPISTVLMGCIKHYKDDLLKGNNNILHLVFEGIVEQLFRDCVMLCCCNKIDNTNRAIINSYLDIITVIKNYLYKIYGELTRNTTTNSTLNTMGYSITEIDKWLSHLEICYDLLLFSEITEQEFNKLMDSIKKEKYINKNKSKNE